MFIRKPLLSWARRKCLARKTVAISRGLANHYNAEDPVPEDKVPHTPVMLREVIQYLAPMDNQVFIDLTFGAGGHTKEILRRGEGICVYGVDRDPTAHEIACDISSKQFPGRLVPVLGRFSEIPDALERLGVRDGSVDGVLIDAGCSSMQFDQPHRGFSVSRNGPLDMRMDANRFPSMPTAADVVNTLNVLQLGKIFKVYGEEKKAKKIAQTIFDARFMMKTIKTTADLASLVAMTLDTNTREDKLDRKVHSATKVFQALRIFVNNELNELNYAVGTVAHRFLRPGGRLVALTFHSLEDRIVKRHLAGVDVEDPTSSRPLSLKLRSSVHVHTLSEMKELQQKKWEPLVKGHVLPSEEEVVANPRSRSAKLRAAVKL